MENSNEFYHSKQASYKPEIANMSEEEAQPVQSGFDFSHQALGKPSMNCFAFDNEVDNEELYFTGTHAFDRNVDNDFDITYAHQAKNEFDNYFNFFELDSTSPRSKSFANNNFNQEFIFDKNDNSYAWRSDLDSGVIEAKKQAAANAKKVESLPAEDFKALSKPMVKIELSKISERKSSSASSPIHVDPEKLSKLFKCLSKTKGVDKDMITEDIVERTIEFGQQKIAEQLKIPYRRYKSILNKVGIKTIAGRKVQNLKLESHLVEWSLKIKACGQILTRKMIHNQAAVFQQDLVKQGDKSLEKVRLSKGWLDKFVKRHEDIRSYLTSQKGKKCD